MMRRLMHNMGWKLLALGIAIALWAAFVGSPELMTSVSAPVQYKNMPAEFEMSSEVPGRIYLEVRGPAARLDSFDGSRSAVLLDLSSVHQPGEYTFTVDRKNVQDLPIGVKLLRAVPGQVQLRFEHRMSADVPVRIRFSTPPPEGYRIAGESVSPKQLKIIGPESRVRQVSYVETDPIDLSHVIGKTQFRVHTFVPDPQVRLVSLPEVEVEINLEKTARGGAISNEGAAVVRN